MVEKKIAYTKKEALDFLASHDAYIVAGGSDMMVVKKNVAGFAPLFDKDVLYVSHIKELANIYEDKEGVHIGATATMHEIEHHKLCPSLLRKAISEVASTNIRHFCTLAGNIANASPAGDTIVVDALLDAKVKLESVDGVRLVDAKDFVLGVRKIDRHPNELITELVFPKHSYSGELWFKVGSRRADSISKLSFAGYYEVKNQVVTQFAVCFGSVSIKPARSKELEAKVVGLSLEQLKEKQPEIAGDFATIISPIDDQRSNKEYRQKVAMNIFNKFISDIIGGAK